MKKGSSYQRKISMLSGIPGIGKKTAKSLLKDFGSIKGIINADINELMKADHIGRNRAMTIIEFANGQEGR